MKKHVLTITTIACLALAGVSATYAKQGHHNSPMRSFAELNLSDQQKQEMRAIFKAAQENNSVYKGEKKEISMQMQDLMEMPTWDQATAESIIRSQIMQGQNIALNRAKAHNQVYNLLTEEQKATLAEKKLKRDDRMASHDGDDRKGKKGKRKGRGKMNLARLSKALDLDDAQVEQFKAIDADAKLQIADKKEQGKARRDSIKTIVQSPSFDENAWLLAQSSTIDDQVTFRLIQTKAHYERFSLLTDDQKEKFSKIMKKMKRKQAKRAA